MDNNDEDKFYKTQLTNTVRTHFGHEHQVTIDATVNRAYGALYFRIVLSVIQLIAIFVGIAVSYLAFKEGNRGLLLTTSTLAISIWSVCAIIRGLSVVDTRVLDTPIIVVIMMVAVISLVLPLSLLFQGILVGVATLLLIGASINNISWDLFLITMVEQKEQYDKVHKDDEKSED